MRLPRYRRELVQSLIQRLRRAVNSLPVSSTQRSAQHLHFSDNLLTVRVTEQIVLVTQVFPGVPQEQPAVLNLARCKHELNDE